MRPHKASGPARRRAGFATAVVLGLVAVVGLLCAGALHDALFGEQLAGSRLLHQRAAALAELGVQSGMARLAATDQSGAQSFALQPLPDSTDSVSVTLRNLGSAAMPGGFSVGRFATHHFEIESTGHTARGVRMTQVQGAVRMLPVAAPAPTEAQP
jgi:Tfp pilus assembly protein PilX